MTSNNKWQLLVVKGTKKRDKPRVSKTENGLSWDNFVETMQRPIYK